MYTCNGVGTCPCLYIGPDSTATAGDHVNPPAVNWLNPDISITPQDPNQEYGLQVGTTYNIVVTVRNHGALASPASTTVQLYWSDPSAGFVIPNPPLDAAQKIGEQQGSVPASGSTDGFQTFPFQWTPDGTALGTNSGHVCLLARVAYQGAAAPCGTPNERYDSTAPYADRMSAIHNVQLTPMMMMRRRHIMEFAFALPNPERIELQTRLVVTPLHPERDHHRLVNLLGIYRVQDYLKGGGAFREPAEVGVALGKERLIARPQALGGHAFHPGCPPRNRLNHTGVLLPELAQALRDHAEKFDRERLIDLVPNETRQGILRVVSEGNPGEIHAVDIRHETIGEQPRLIGGLTVLYRTVDNHF